MVDLKYLFLLFLAVLCFQHVYSADTTKVDINLDVERSVGQISTFDREKYIVLHSSPMERDWIPENEKLDYVFGDLDVYFGRDNGGINWWLGQIHEDPSRSGYANPAEIASNGAAQRKKWKDYYSKKYDSKSDVMIGGQYHAIWPGKKTGWQFANEEAIGEYMARYVNEFYRDFNDDDIGNGLPAPRFVEVLNEPAYNLYDDSNIPEKDKVPLIDIFRFHRDVAKGFKKFNSSTKIGGYCAAFPEYDIDNFQRWHDRMKLFVDSAGAQMDFYALHFYDFNRHWHTGNTSHIHFKGSRVDATLDMLEQYSILKDGMVKPMVLSEIGGRDHKLESQTYSPQRDWMTLKAMSALTMQFMERPDNIAKVVPFIMNKAPWSSTPHAWRLMIQEREPDNYVPNDWDSKYEFSQLIKFYELWSEVKGTRVDSWSNNPDVLVDAYVEGNIAYLLYSNLSFREHMIQPTLKGLGGNFIQNIEIKHLYASSDVPVLEIKSASNFDPFLLAPEATAIVKISFDNELSFENQSMESKHYANSYLKPIIANQPIEFTIDNVVVSEFGEGELRLAFGRDHEKSKVPIVNFNGTILSIPDNISGESQSSRAAFFGMLKIAVPNDIILDSNNISVKFNDTGGHVSSVTLRKNQHTRKINRSNKVTEISLYPESMELGIAQKRILTAEILPAYAGDKRIEWTSNDSHIAMVDENGNVTGVSKGNTVVTATTIDGGFTATCTISVKEDRVPIDVDYIEVFPQSAELIIGNSLELDYQVFPIDADNKTVSWSSSNNNVASVNSNGLVLAKSNGAVTIRAIAHNDVEASSVITVKTLVPGSISITNGNAIKSNSYYTGGELTVTANFTATTGRVVDSKGVKFWLRELKSNWTPVRDYVAWDATSAGKFSGTASATISLNDAIPSRELPSGNFYWIWATFDEADGDFIKTQYGVSPVTIIRSTDVSDFDDNNVILYPNPANSQIFIRGCESGANIKVYTICGDLVFQEENVNQTFNVDHLSDGIYLAEIISAGKRLAKRIVINR